MSIQSEINRINANIGSAYDALVDKGALMPKTRNTANLAATIQSVSKGGNELIVTAPTGSTVTVTKDEETKTAAENNGTWLFQGLEAGNWTITATKDGSTLTSIVVIAANSASISFVDPTFANNSWDDIVAACHGRYVPDTWVVGDHKTMTINGTNYQIDIIGKNHDDYADGSGKAPLTFQLHTCYATKYAMNTSNTNVGGWASSLMRTSYLPAILSLMPSEVKAGIRQVSKLTSNGNKSTKVSATDDKLFLLAENETVGYYYISAAGEGDQYAYYKAGNSARKTFDGSYSNYFLRSPYKSNTGGFAYIQSDGNPNACGASLTQGVPFAFCF